MWNSIYDFLTQFFAGLKWSAFLAQNNENIVLASQMRNVFRNDLYQVSGLLTLFMSLLVTLIYYFVINKKGGSGYAFKFKYWSLTLGINSLLIVSIVFYVSIRMTSGYSMLNPFKFILALGFINLIYSALVFFVLSVVFKRFSVANTTPF